MISKRFTGHEFRSLYLRMRDGVRVAIDVTLPADLGDERVPTVLRQTRYHRRMDFRGPMKLPSMQKLFDQHYDARRYFVEHGYAWVDVCARGSGASGGERRSPWSIDEIDDGAEILDWIVAQPWSNGAVGARGVSYDGTAAEFLMWHGHPALKAVVPRFALFDTYEDIAMPGGIHLHQFTENWAAFNDALDRNRFDDVLRLILTLSEGARRQLGMSQYGNVGDRIGAAAMKLRWPVSNVLGSWVRGVAPVNDDGGAVDEHVRYRTRNLNVHEAAAHMTYRDDVGLSPRDPELSIGDFSPHTHLEKLGGSAAVYHYSGWFDGAYQRAAIKRFLAHDAPNHHLILGPWEHGGQQQISPWSKARASKFDHNREIRKFFDAHLRDNEHAAKVWSREPRVKYYTMGKEQWQFADSWPPEGFTKARHYLTPAGLSREPGEGRKSVAVTGKHGTGEASRWRCLLPLLSLVHYHPRQGDEVVHFTGPALTHDIEVTGHPIAHIELVSTTDDPRVFVYIEDVAPDDTVHYVTEGMLRAIHRFQDSDKPAAFEPMIYHSFLRADHLDAPAGERLVLVFDLLPTSYLFQRGHKMRISVAGADADHFEVGPHGVHQLDMAECWVELPQREVR